MTPMTARDRAILSSLADWDPPADIVAARESWERHAEELNRDLPVVGAFTRRSVWTPASTPISLYRPVSRHFQSFSTCTAAVGHSAVRRAFARWA